MCSLKMIAIIDYGMGNLHSVEKALQSFGEETCIASRPEEIKKCAKVVLPGVGAFDDAVVELEKQGLIPAIKAHLKKGRILLGICLGMQLIFTESQEAKEKKGLNLLKGQVKKFTPTPHQKVPHMGWNQLKIKNKDCPLLKDLPDKSFVYFCHSYYPDPLDKAVVATTTDYGLDFASVVWKDNLYAVQFHPEKSQEIGLKILKNFVQL